MSDPRLPRYQLIRDDIARGIAEKRWAVGEPIPSEAELAQTYGVAIGTIRKAVELLIDQALVERLHGKGTFVRRPNFSSSLFRFFRISATSGETLLPSGSIKDRRRAKPPPEARAALRLGAGDSAVLLKRTRVVNSKVLLLEEIWLPESRFPGILDVNQADLEPLLYPAYEALFGVLVISAEETLTVALADEPTAKTLSLKAGAPLMVIERCAFDQDRTPVEWRRSVGPAEGFRYKIDVR